MADVRGAMVLTFAVLFFLFIVGLFALSTVMQPRRWSERPRLVP